MEIMMQTHDSAAFDKPHFGLAGKLTLSLCFYSQLFFEKFNISRTYICHIIYDESIAGNLSDLFKN